MVSFACLVSAQEAPQAPGEAVYCCVLVGWMDSLKVLQLRSYRYLKSTLNNCILY